MTQIKWNVFAVLRDQDSRLTNSMRKADLVEDVWISLGAVSNDELRVYECCPDLVDYLIIREEIIRAGYAPPHFLGNRLQVKLETADRANDQPKGN